MIRALLLAALLAAPALAQESLQAPDAAPAPEADGPMTPVRLGRILTALDPSARFTGNGWEIVIEDVPVLIVFDPLADRMRAMVPVRGAEAMTEEELMRVLQANFDSALDARYAVANGRLWTVFLHPLRSLERDQLISGIGQAVNAATTYGTLYTGGAGQFGSGDSGRLQAELLERLLDRGRDI